MSKNADPPFASLSSIESLRGLTRIQWALERSVDICCVFLAAIPETRVKIQLGKEIWYLTASADLVRRRIGELKTPQHGTWAPPRKDVTFAYVAFTNALLEVTATGPRLKALHEWLLADLRAQVEAQRARTRTVADRPTADALEIVAHYLDEQLRWYSDAAVQWVLDGGEHGLEVAGTAWRACGGLAGRDDPHAPHAEPAISGLLETPAREERLEILPRFAPLPPGAEKFSAAGLQIVTFVIEICAAEICARNIVDYPEMPWEFRVDMAKQTWDEVRHAEMCLARSEELGGFIGMHPVDVAVWRMYRLGESLAEKLIIEQRLGEAKGLDNGFSTFIHSQDPTLRVIFDYLLVDELTHVGKGNRWIHYLLGGDPARIRAAEESAYAKIVAAKLGWIPPEVWVDGRLAAGFSTDEVREQVEYRARMVGDGNASHHQAR